MKYFASQFQIKLLYFSHVLLSVFSFPLFTVIHYLSSVSMLYTRVSTKLNCTVLE